MKGTPSNDRSNDDDTCVQYVAAIKHAARLVASLAPCGGEGTTVDMTMMSSRTDLYDDVVVDVASFSALDVVDIT